jgi:hypothetical protein
MGVPASTPRNSYSDVATSLSSLVDAMESTLCPSNAVPDVQQNLRIVSKLSNTYWSIQKHRQRATFEDLHCDDRARICAIVAELHSLNELKSQAVATEAIIQLCLRSAELFDLYTDIFRSMIERRKRKVAAERRIEISSRHNAPNKTDHSAAHAVVPLGIMFLLLI